MLRAEYSRKLLKFKETAITSRSKMNDKETFIIHVTDDDIPGATGTGECALFRGLSAEDTPDYERQLNMHAITLNHCLPYHQYASDSRQPCSICETEVRGVS